MRPTLVLAFAASVPVLLASVTTPPAPVPPVASDPIRAPVTLRSLAEGSTWGKTTLFTLPEVLSVPASGIRPASSAFESVIARLAAADGAVIDFRNGRKAFVTDAAWLAEFKHQLSDSGKPAAQAPCFCIAPQIQFLKGNDVLVSVELTHDYRVRFWGLSHLGDFVLPEANYSALAKLERAAFPSAITFPKASAAKHRSLPARVELKP